jgi:hypothetical protein
MRENAKTTRSGSIVSCLESELVLFVSSWLRANSCVVNTEKRLKVEYIN